MTIDNSIRAAQIRGDWLQLHALQSVCGSKVGTPDIHCWNTNYGTNEDYSICRCSHCHEFSVWHSGKLVFPFRSNVPEANDDLPEEIKNDYAEASLIVGVSPRAAAALLRLAIQKICSHLGGKGQNLNADIAALVSRGLPAPVQQALDIVRVVGNNAVHPGQLDLRDDEKTATSLFGLINLIAEVMISQPKHVAALYQTVVPESQRAAIKERDRS